MNLKAAVIGLGNIGFLYDIDQNDKIRTHVKAFQIHEKVELIAGIDPSEKARKKFTSTTGIASYKDLDEIEDKVDIIAIASPTRFHFEHLKKAIERKPKLIILEKPVVQKKSEFKAVIDLMLETKIPIFVNYIRRVDNSSVELKNRITSGDLGELLNVEITYNRGLFNIASHFINLISYFFGKIEGTKALSKPKEITNLSGDFQLDFELDLGKAKCHFKSLDHHEVHESHQKYNFENGTIEIKAGPEILLNGEIVPHDYPHYQLNVLNHLIDHLENGTPLVSNLESAMGTADICFQLLEG